MRAIKIASNKQLRELYEVPKVDSPKLYNPSIFVERDQAKKSKLMTAGQPLGPEFDPDVTNDDEYTKKVFNLNNQAKIPQTGNTYPIVNPNTINLNIVKPVQPVTLGASTGDLVYAKAYPAFSSSFTSQNSGSLYYTLGNYAIKKLGKGPNDYITQEEFFVVKLRWLLKMAKMQRDQHKNNLNNLRSIMERIIEEASPAFHTGYFLDERSLSKVLKKLSRFFAELEPQKAVLLTYKLFKMHLKQLDLQNPVDRKEVADKFYNVFIPYLRLMEVRGSAIREKLSYKRTNLVTYKKISALSQRPDILSILSQFQDPKSSPEFANDFRCYLRETVTLDKALKDLGNQCKEIMPICPTIVQDKVPSLPETRESLNDLDDPEPNFYTDNATSMELDERPSVNTCHIGNYNFHCHDSVQNKGKASKAAGKLIEGSFSVDSSNYDTANQEIMNDPDLYDKTQGSKDVSLGEKTPSNKSLNDLPVFIGQSVLSGLNPTETLSQPVPVKLEGVVHPQNKSQFAPLSQAVPAQLGTVVEPLHKTQFQRVLHKQKSGEGRNLLPENANLSFDPTRVTEKPDIVRINSFQNLPTPHAVVQEVQPVQPVQVVQQPAPVQEKQHQPLARMPSIGQKNHASLTKTAKEIMFQKVIDLAYDKTQKWEVQVDNAIIKIDKIKPENSPVILLRAWSTIENFTPQEVFKQIYDTESRAKWDMVTMELQCLEKIDPTSEIMYFYIKTPFGITDRDFIQKRHHQLEYPEKGQIVMCYGSTAHPSKPPVKNRVRGDTHFGGYLLKPSDKKPNSTDLCILSQVDVKGSIPKSIFNMVAAKAPAEWITRLTKACHNAYKR